jgi:hypothetical protein
MITCAGVGRPQADASTVYHPVLFIYDPMNVQECQMEEGARVRGQGGCVKTSESGGHGLRKGRFCVLWAA